MKQTNWASDGKYCEIFFGKRCWLHVVTAHYIILVAKDEAQGRGLCNAQSQLE